MIRFYPDNPSVSYLKHILAFHYEESFPTVPPYLREDLMRAANSAVTANTHSTYRTALSSWHQCCAETGIVGSFPAKEDDILTYVGWLLHKQICAATISSYLSGIRAAHLEKGTNPPVIRTDLVNLVLHGEANRDNLKKKTGKKKSRIPMTPTSLKLLKAELSASDMSYHDKRLIWAVSSILYFGALRPGEVLCKNSNSFEPTSSLLLKDLTVKACKINEKDSKLLQVYISSEKTNTTGKGRLIDIYSCPASDLCPVRAYSKFCEASNLKDDGKPAFRLRSGKNFTTNLFNKKLKQYLGKHLNSETGFVSGHSFRIGITSLVSQLGYDEDQIKSLGRWSSQAYLSYIRLPRTRRQEIARALQDAA